MEDKYRETSLHFVFSELWGYFLTSYYKYFAMVTARYQQLYRKAILRRIVYRENKCAWDLYLKDVSTGRCAKTRVAGAFTLIEEKVRKY